MKVRGVKFCTLNLHFLINLLKGYRVDKREVDMGDTETLKEKIQLQSKV